MQDHQRSNMGSIILNLVILSVPEVAASHTAIPSQILNSLIYLKMKNITIFKSLFKLIK